MGVTLRHVTDALEAVLEDRVKGIDWTVSIMGATYPKKTTGYIICDGVSYENFRKEEQIAKATFGIQIICPNPKKEVHTEIVEDLAMQVRQVLKEEYDLDGWVMDSSVNRVDFATAKGLPYIGVAIIEYEVKYEEA